MNSPFATIVAALVPCFVLGMCLARACPAQLQRFRRAKRLHQLAIILLLGYAAYSTQKPTPPKPAEGVAQAMTYIKAYNLFPDLSGRFLPWLRSLASREASTQSAAIYEATEAAIADGTNTLRALSLAAAANADAPRLHLAFAARLPNNNLKITVAEWQDHEGEDGRYLDALVHFSTPPATNVAVNLEFSLAADHAEPLAAVTNSFPATERVAGLDCYRYRYRYPNTSAQLLPRPDIALGGYAGQFFDAIDIIVDDGETYYYSYTGWDDYSDGDTELRVRYSHGIAVEAVYNGATIRGNAAQTAVQADNEQPTTTN